MAFSPPRHARQTLLMLIFGRHFRHAMPLASYACRQAPPPFADA